MRILLILLVVLCANQSRAESETKSVCEISQIAMQDAMRKSQTLPPDDDGENPTQELPCGWKWIKEYVIDCGELDLWRWRSWPDGVNLTITDK